jgi:hypothetical protein
MLITPLEAIELLVGLEIDQYGNEKLSIFKEEMNKTIQNFRLGIEIYTGKKHSTELRKTYTCPFFNKGVLGCSLSRSSKPYGCLGFNPKIKEDNGQSCASNLKILESRETDFCLTEDQVNTKIRNTFNIKWTKQNIPQALLDMLENSNN